MSATDGDIRHAYGELHIGRAEAKRAYERLRKRSYRRLLRSQSAVSEFLANWPDDPTPDIYLDGDHAVYVRGVKDMLNELSGGGSKL